MLVFIALALLLVSPQARGDARQDARRDFKKGMELIAAGQYDAGIAELEAAYAIKPHPNVLYNIARAHLDAGRVVEALQHYRRYLATEPRDREVVAATIAKLEVGLAQARQPAPVPEPAAAPPVPAAASEKRLADLLARLEDAVDRVEKLEASPREEPGAARSAPQSLLEQPGSEVEAGLPAYEEMVFSASRRAQSALEAPVATTVITEEEIRLSGAQSVPELLRRVPGADVSIMGVASANVSMRGFNQRLSNKLLVLVDGRTVYEDFLGFTHWPLLPISIEDIERIEVMRGPGSTLYGANAFMGVLNIITKSAGAGSRATAHLLAGTGDSAGASLSTSGREGRVRYRASFGYQQADKWSVDFSDDRADVTPTAKDPTLGLRAMKANMVVDFVPAPAARFALSGGTAQIFSELYPSGLLRNFNYDGTESYLKADAALGALKLKTFWTHSQATSEPQYWSTGTPSIASELTSDIVDAEVQIDSDFTLVGDNRLVAGLGWRMKRARWTYLPELALEHHFSAFVQDEWRPWKPLMIVGSYRIDRHPLLDEGQPGFAHSPRGAVLLFFTPTLVLRGSVSTAFRVPTFLESYLDLRLPVAGVDGAEMRIVGNPRLKPEQIFNLELGFSAVFDRVTFELAAYRSQVHDLMQFGALIPASAPTWNPETGRHLAFSATSENDPAVFTALGAEVGVKASPFDRTDLRLNVALENVSTDAADSEECVPCSQVPFLKVFGSATARLARFLDLSADASYVGGTTWVQSETAKDDPTLPMIATYPLKGYVVVNARLAARLLDDRLALALVGTNLASMHKEHPFGNFVERRLFLSLGGAL
ncbi:MAG: TonB-dependent receptor [Deltaproteobacteria bacterium]|nr:TonB-dependent receptor [Deltaproteobacteria bacterium]